MARLIPCPHCHAHVMLDERRCPHCSTELRTAFAPRAATTLLLGLALAGCPGDDTTDDGAGTQGTTAPTSGTATASGTGTDTTSDGSIGSGGVEYGTVDTSMDDDTGTTGGTDSTGTDSASGTETLGEPEYGVPETTSG
ncbi:MAG: hypothetical protein AB1Z98_01250 [Nannocystaceae bacterium]